MRNQKIENNYNESTIKILKGLQAVRVRPGMYIGSTDSQGLHQLVWEIVDNSVDEVLAGYGKLIKIIIHPDNSVTVIDHGRGIPVGKHSSGKPTPEVIFTILHAGGKFGQGSYKTSGGLHGVGSSVVNALSEKLTVEINRNGFKYKEAFHNGGKPLGTLKKVGKTNDPTGTTITFKPDSKIFSTIVFNFTKIAEHLRESAFLLKDTQFVLIDERTQPHQIKEYHFKNGIKEFVKSLNEDKKTISGNIYFEGKQKNIEVEVSAQYNSGYSETLFSFVNNVRTSEGGSHETGFKIAWTKAFNEYARKNHFLKKKDPNLEVLTLEKAYQR